MHDDRPLLRWTECRGVQLSSPILMTEVLMEGNAGHAASAHTQ